MTNVSTLMALAVIGLITTFGLGSAYADSGIHGNATSTVHVYIHDMADIGFDVTVVEGGSVTVHNELSSIIEMEHTGTWGTSNGGTFSGTILANGGVKTFDFPITNCSSCYPAGYYYFKESTGLGTGSITIVHPEGWLPPVQEEVGITESVVVVLGSNSEEETTPEPDPIEPEPTGINNVATWTGTYDLVSLQEQLAEVNANLNNAMEQLGLEKNKVEGLEETVDQLRNASLLEQGLLEEQRKTISEAEITIENLKTELSTPQINQQQIAKYETLQTKYTNDISLLEQQKAELTIEKEKWKTLSDNWYAVALEQLRVMVIVLGL